MIIKVTECNNCPFANHDNEYGLDKCNLSDKVGFEIDLTGNDTLPYKGVYEKCPLKTNDIEIQLNL